MTMKNSATRRSAEVLTAEAIRKKIKAAARAMRRNRTSRRPAHRLVAEDAMTDRLPKWP